MTKPTLGRPDNAEADAPHHPTADAPPTAAEHGSALPPDRRRVPNSSRAWLGSTTRQPTRPQQQPSMARLYHPTGDAPPTAAEHGSAPPPDSRRAADSSRAWLGSTTRQPTRPQQQPSMARLYHPTGDAPPTAAEHGSALPTGSRRAADSSRAWLGSTTRQPTRRRQQPSMARLYHSAADAPPTAAEHGSALPPGRRRATDSSRAWLGATTRRAARRRRQPSMARRYQPSNPRFPPSPLPTDQPPDPNPQSLVTPPVSRPCNLADIPC